MKTQTLSDNFGEHLEIHWDGERYALIQDTKRAGRRVFILNEEEIDGIVRFRLSINPQFPEWFNKELADLQSMR